jgi:hypothetical protein
MNAIAPRISMPTRSRLTPPSFQTSPRRKRAEKHDASLEPEFVGSDTGLEDRGEAEDVGDDQARRMAQRTYSMLGKINGGLWRRR